MFLDVLGTGMLPWQLPMTLRVPPTACGEPTMARESALARPSVSGSPTGDDDVLLPLLPLLPPLLLPPLGDSEASSASVSLAEKTRIDWVLGCWGREGCLGSRKTQWTGGHRLAQLTHCVLGGGEGRHCQWWRQYILARRRNGRCGARKRPFASDGGTRCTSWAVW